MSFLTPLALWGLLTLPVILMLHLLRNRRQLSAVSSLQLWRDLQQIREGRLLRYVLLSFMLLLQLCVATALTLALARPVFSFLLDRPRQVIFILDMTTSMTAEDVTHLAVTAGGNRRFDAARQIIQSQLLDLDKQDSFALISLDPRPQILLAGDGEQTTQALLTLDNLVPGATGLDLPAALTLANSLIESIDREHKIFILTDGAYPVEPAELPPMLAPVSWQIISSQPATGGVVPNQALLNVSARTLPDERHRLFARLVNYSQAPIASTLRVSADKILFDEIVVELEPQGETGRVWTLPAQTETAAVEIVEPDVLPLDNQAELLLAGISRYRVLLISDTPDVLAQALKIQPGVKLTIDSLARARYNPADFDLVVFEGLPPALDAWPEGNLLLVSPPLDHPLLPAPDFARNLRPDPESLSPLLAGIDLSGVYFKRAPQLALPDWAEADLLALPHDPEQEVGAGQALIFNGSVGHSHMLVWAFDLAESNLGPRLALPLLTANTLSSLLSSAPPAVMPVGEPVLLGGNFSVETPAGRRLFAPLSDAESKNNVFYRTQKPGLYKIYDDDDAPVAGFAVHAGSALESNLNTQLQPDALNLLQIERPLADPEIDYQDYWFWLAALALGVVIIEGWLAWRK